MTLRRTAVITGAGSGLGLALALELANRGMDLALIDKDAARLSSALSRFDTRRNSISIHHADISVETEVIQVRDQILKAHGGVHWLINNAGVSISQPFESMRQSDFEWLFNTNFWGAVYCCRHFLPDLLQAEDARIVNVSSIFAWIGLPWKSAYAASKAALAAYSQSLASELKASGVRVSVVIPPPLNTGIVAAGLHVNPDLQAAESAFLKKHGSPLDRTAKQIVRQVEEGDMRIAPGLKMKLAERFSRFSPSGMQWIVKRMK